MADDYSCTRVLERRFSACELRVAAISSTLTIEDERGIFSEISSVKSLLFLKPIGFGKIVAGSGSLERLTITLTANGKFEDYVKPKLEMLEVA